MSCGSDNISSPISDSSPDIGASTAKVTAQSVLSDIEKGRYREGEILVKFKSGVVSAMSSKSHEAMESRTLKRFHLVRNLEHVRLPEGLSVKEAIIRYMSDPNVEYAEPNYIKRASAIPNDTNFGSQWALLNTGQTGGTTGADIKATGAWDITTGSSSVVVAVIDSGIDLDHPDLRENIWTNSGETSCNDGIDNDGNGFVDDCRGWNFAGDNNISSDDNGHGTHVAGIVGAVGNNGQGISGVMWDVQLMALKFLDSDGVGTVADEVSAIQYALAKGVRVINASFGGVDSRSERDAIALANTSGVLVVAAAGNGGTDVIGDNNDDSPTFPASYGVPHVINGVPFDALPNIIAVAAADQNDNLAFFSDFGPQSIHVAAPGENILSTVPTGFFPFGYAFFSGTSMATAYVTGLAGLTFSRAPGLTHLQARDLILNNVDELPNLSGLLLTGGRINAFKTVSSVPVSSGGSDDGGGGGGGGCSVGKGSNAQAGKADIAIMLVPLILVMLARRRK